MMLQPTLLRWSPLMALLFLGCGVGESPAPGEGEGADAASQGLIADAGGDAEREARSDASTIGGLDGLADVSGADGAVEAEEVTPSSPDATSSDGCPGAMGCFCDTDEACESGICVTEADASAPGYCSSLCDAGCPEGYVCDMAEGFEAPLCVLPSYKLCLACDDSSVCGLGGGECLEGRCTQPCSAAMGCPEGFSCVDGRCATASGQCPCMDTTEGEVQGCVTSNAFGACEGEQVCMAEGWSSCDAPEAAEEVCDALDNDCDGQIDEGAPLDDFDADGIIDCLDFDDDADGVHDTEDAFPFDASESKDTDGDGQGDNSDPDLDGDGIDNALDADIDGDGVDNASDAFPSDPDKVFDLDGDGVEDADDPDIDGDGVANEEDAFPNDGSASSDLDGDGIADGLDDDIDGDGVENTADPDPLDASLSVDSDGDGVDDSEDADLDGDGVPNTSDPDIDGDGLDNSSDAFPNDPSEVLDSDGDGVGDNADLDDDNDGTPDAIDAFPLDPSEWADVDGDGVGDNVDEDLDNDGVENSSDADQDGDGVDNNADALPKDPSETQDTDGDGVGDNADLDDDGDGVADSEDSFPLDASSAKDLDGDGIPDAVDPDLDGDGVPNEADAFPEDDTKSSDIDGDGIADAEDADMDGDGILNEGDEDRDGDGVNNGEDAFPDLASESADNDADGLGDNADPDDDDDGTPDVSDAFPFDATASKDTDGDGVSDVADPDIDGDGIPNGEDSDQDGDGVEDALDAFPLDATESKDSDGDGVGDVADDDDDGDGVPDVLDAMPLDPTESVDSDGDGLGDNADLDDDNDGVPDTLDAMPLDPSESLDTDGDGIPNGQDIDIDGDGLLNEADGDMDGDADPNESDCAPKDPAFHQLATEWCDGLDNDCSGLADDPFTDLGSACDTDDSDLCKNGTVVCSEDGTTTYCPVEVVSDLTELCSGYDEDCDGEIDEDAHLDCPDLGACVLGVCQAPTCEDTLHNGEETDVDCGGPCSPCGEGLSCATDADCESGTCEVNDPDGPSCTAPTYSWVPGDFGECSTSCGEGLRERTVSCIRSDGALVDASLCQSDQPATTEPCQATEACVFEVGDFGACSTSCGAGLQTREVTCMGPEGAVALSFCASLEAPEATQACSETLACAWTVDAWEACSSSCGDGVQTRSVTCSGPDGAVEDTFCSGAKPTESQFCTDSSACAWTTSAWGACSTTCGSGTQERAVSCSGPDGEVSDSLCSAVKPEVTQACQDTSACGWSAGAFGACSTTCGAGTQTRSVVCTGPDGDVDEGLCAEAKPATSQSCTDAQGCSWVAGAWEGCSTTCGDGSQSRIVTCSGPDGEVDEGLCSGSKPATSQGCTETGACAWSTGAWGACDNSCGSGNQSRTVSCSGPSGGVPESYCSGGKPTTVQGCVGSTSCSWSTGGWGGCSASCDGGSQSRSVSCVAPSGGVVSDGLCGGSKPASSQSCNTHACVVYTSNYGSGPCWTPTCGGGYGTPAACPSGYAQTGFGQACGQPLNYVPSSALCQNAAVGSAEWTLCRFMAIHGWGCVATHPLIGVSVRECTWQ